MQQPTGMQHDKKTFYVTNRGLAALLVTKGYEVLDFSKGANKKGQMQLRINFENSQGLQDIVDEFWNGSVMVDARPFNDACRDLNMRIKREVQ